MKKIIIIALICLSILSVYSITTPKSMSFSNSYFQRSTGVDALHWNPANIGEASNFEIPFVNNSLSLTNNLFDQDMNGISGKYLTEKDKLDLLNEIDGYFVAEGSMRNTIFGLSEGNKGFAIGLNTLTSLKITEELLKIVIFGNENDEYDFDKSDINYRLLSYIDFTYGMGGFKIEDLDVKDIRVHDINYGFSVSLLTGIADIGAKRFSAQYRANTDDGIHFDADLYQRENFFGLGFKGNISISAKVEDNLSLGMGFDNVAGFIKWVGDSKERRTHYWMEDVFISDLDEDLLSDEDSLEDVDSETTTLPMIYRFGSLYDFGRVDLSFDYEHTFDDDDYKLGKNKFAFATEIRYLNRLPIQLGLQLNDGENEVVSSIGFGYRGQSFETGISVQTADTFFPSMDSKSLSFGLYTLLKL
jgi:hypothetical protein